MNMQNKTKGFTIIEVVLVLAIAGLIFLMIFLALPALQRNQRDTQRKSDVGRFVSAVGSYKANNQGKLPTDIDATAGVGASPIIGSTYLENFTAPGGDAYTVALGTLGASPTSWPVPSAETVINYYPGRKCDFTASTGRTAVVIMQENGNVGYCQDL